MTRILRNLAFATAAAIVAAGGAGAQEPTPAVQGNHLEHPVYYETYDEPLLPHDANLKDLRKGLLTLRHYPAVDVSSFDWTTSETSEYSWWIQVEELRFLLPFIRSGRPEDRDVAESWFKSWYVSHHMNPDANRARWGEAMSAAYRGMVLVYYLKTEELRTQPDDDLVGLLREMIHVHQEYLAEDTHFSRNSNHGMVESMGLLEVTRVFPDSTLERLGLDRMLEITKTSVSSLGVHNEHSPLYHFVFLDWVDRSVEYLDRLPFLDRGLVDELFEYRDRMLGASYYLQDHGGTVAQVGDSDSVLVDERYPRFRVRTETLRPPVLFDREAAYAVYKGNRSDKDRRYVVFANQCDRPVLKYHYHNDALSVYYADDGEVLLGDQGKYEYAHNRERRYFVSPAAHNTVFSKDELGRRAPRYTIYLADSTSFDQSGEGVSFYGAVRHTSAYVERTVRVPRGRDGIVVEDVLRWPPIRSGSERMQFRDVSPGFSVIMWNVGPDVTSIERSLAAGAGEYAWHLTTVSGRRFRLRIAVEGLKDGVQHEVDVVEGGDNPLLGWYSPSMFNKRPRPSIMLFVRTENVARVTSRIHRVGGETPFALRVLLRGY
jgi:hypothetical protein